MAGRTDSEAQVSESSCAGRMRERARHALQQVPRLLLIRLRSLGDSILTLPLVEALHQWRPELRIDVLIEAPFAPVFRRNPGIREILMLRSRTAAGMAGWTKPQAVLQILRRRYPMVLDLHGGTTSLTYSLLSASRWRVGQECYRHAWAYNVRIPDSSLIWQRERVHTAEHQLTLLRWLNLPGGEVPPARIDPGHEARQSAAERLQKSGLAPGGYILIHPTATLFTKQWPEKNFAELADRLERYSGLPVVFTSAPREAQVLLNIGRHASGRYFYWSDLNVDGLFALIEFTRLFIGNDSGPTHAAAALGRPIVVVWGSSNFDVWHPWATDFEAVRSDLPCMPCPGYSCAAFGEPRCIVDIPVDRVFDACRRQLHRIARIDSRNSMPNMP